MRATPFRQTRGPIIRAPYPLPKKRERVKSGIARAPKRVWLRHRKFVRSHYCSVPGCRALLIDVAHLRAVSEGAGTSLKPHTTNSPSACVGTTIRKKKPAAPIRLATGTASTCGRSPLNSCAARRTCRCASPYAGRGSGAVMTNLKFIGGASHK